MNVAFIYNPRAGVRRTDIAGQLRAFGREPGRSAEIFTTTGRGHATELAREAVRAGCDIVAAVGGDGTVNETGRALAGTGVALALVPRGSGNGLARHLRVPLDAAGALAVLRRGRVRTIDTGMANGRLFLCTMGAGFDAAVVRRFEALPRRGIAAYFGAGALELLRYRPERLRLSVDGGDEFARRPLFTVVANAAQFGSGARIAPHARVDDGRLDLVSVDAVNPFQAGPLLWRLFRGTIDRSRHVLTRPGTRFTLERDSPGPMHVDGELVETAARVEIEVRPASLRVIAP